jgi:hypothetical protein
MSKKKSEFLGALGKYMEISKAVLNEVLGLGGSDDDLRRIITDKALRQEIAKLIVKGKKVEEGIFSVTVNYNQALAQMIKAGNYNWANDDITSEHFPIVGVGEKEYKLVYVHLDRSATTKEVLEEMNRRGLEPAKIEHLLFFGAKYPEEQRKFPIVELGSDWVHPLGRRLVAYLYVVVGERGLSLDWGDPDVQWGDYYRFLAVSK